MHGAATDGNAQLQAAAGIVGIGADQILLQVGQSITVRVLIGIIGVESVEVIGYLPRIGHSVAIAVERADGHWTRARRTGNPVGWIVAVTGGADALKAHAL